MDSEVSRLIERPWFSLCTAPSVCHVVTTSDEGKKSEMEVSADWCVAVEYWRLSSIRVYLR